MGEETHVKTAESRIDVRSADGTTLAVWMDGAGPPLVLVHGSFQDHTAQVDFVAELRRSFTTFSLDRRGCGASDDGAAYSIEREFEDVAAVVEEASEQTGRPVRITAPTLVLSGSQSPDPVRRATRDAAAAIPGALVHVLHGHDHFAHRTQPAMVASVIRDFAAS